jgi:GINS complex subunit 2
MTVTNLGVRPVVRPRRRAVSAVSGSVPGPPVRRGPGGGVVSRSWPRPLWSATAFFAEFETEIIYIGTLDLCCTFMCVDCVCVCTVCVCTVCVYLRTVWILCVCVCVLCVCVCVLCVCVLCVCVFVYCVSTVCVYCVCVCVQCEYCVCTVCVCVHRNHYNQGVDGSDVCCWSQSCVS